jgi:nicotinic acid mononucleotide adenylyltransferase
MSWEKKNHGGDPTTNESKKYAIFIGRFQPPHKGHTELINQKLKDNVPILIMVRDIEPDKRNPLTTNQTIFLLEKYYSTKNGDVTIIPIPDIESVNFGRGVGYEINEFIPPKDVASISATGIRNSIKNGDDYWKKLIDESMQDDIFNFLGN